MANTPYKSDLRERVGVVARNEGLVRLFPILLESRLRRSQWLLVGVGGKDPSWTPEFCPKGHSAGDTMEG